MHKTPNCYLGGAIWQTAHQWCVWFVRVCVCLACPLPTDGLNAEKIISLLLSIKYFKFKKYINKIYYVILYLEYWFYGVLI